MSGVHGGPLGFGAAECERSIVARIRAIAEMQPDAGALRGDEEPPLSFSTLAEMLGELGRGLSTRGGSPGDRVGVLMKQEPSAVVAQLAVLAAGRVVVPLDHLAPPSELEAVLTAAEPTAVLVDPGLAGNLEGTGFEGVAVDPGMLIELARSSTSQEDRASAQQEDITGLDPAYLLFTSGSVGQPKGATTLHGAFLRPAHALFRQEFIRPGDRVAVAAPMPFMAAIDMILWSLCCGAEVCLFSVRERGPQAFVSWMRDTGTTIWGTATAAMRALASGVPPRALPTLRLIMVGGEVLYGQDVLDTRPVSALDLDIMSVYAATEVPLISWRLVASSEDVEGVGALDVGRPLPGTSMSLEPPLTASSEDGEGELVLDAPIGSLGYWRRPDLADRFEFDRVRGRMRYRTGDLARTREDGSYEVVGRVDLMVKIHGRQVNLPTVEEALRADPRVGGAAVVTVPGSKRSRELVAHITSAGPEPVDASAVRRTMRRSLPPHMVPNRVVTHDALPVTARGKVDRALLEASSDPVEVSSSRPPSTATERAVHAVWVDVLGRDDFGAEDDFFELGGDSLSSTELMIALEKRFGLWEPLSSWIDSMTVEAIAETIDGARTGRSKRTNLIQRGAPGRPPLVVVYDLHGGAFRFRMLAESIGRDQEVWGLENPMLDGFADMPRSLEALSRLHVGDLREQFGGSPVNLVGYSGAGSFTAFEIARRVLEDGGKLGFLCFIDFGPVHLRHGGDPASYRPPGAWPNRPRSDLRALNRLARGWAEVRDAEPGARLQRLSRLLDMARPYDLTLARLDEARRGRVRPELRTAVMWYRLMDALVEYDFEPIDASAVLLASDQSAKGNIAVSRRLDYDSLTEPTMGWGPYVRGGVAVRPIVGHHNDLMEPPYVEGVGTAVRDAFDDWLSLHG